MKHDGKPICYFDNRLKVDAIKLLPGQFYVTGSNKVLVTILGSCVAACILDVEKQIGGMNHFMLPDTTISNDANMDTHTKYGISAMDTLIEELVNAGARRDKLVAKVFGGGQVLPSFVQQDIGRVNAEFVLEYLKCVNISLVSSDLMSNYARKIYFFPSSGSVYMKRIRDFHNATLHERETTHRVLLTEQAKNHLMQTPQSEFTSNSTQYPLEP
ncbi:chemoreceptor glutamine deamidase CheD [Alteromonas sp. D210916BOD_24]|uniref:chemoreceptor glutamine deamidase CheD n=1 Tax=Alteromonas sp. D210916BOD_24 TaxID=3157618 RepID=UPI00399CA5D9